MFPQSDGHLGPGQGVPVGVEVCDGVDNDCDGETDEPRDDNGTLVGLSVLRGLVRTGMGDRFLNQDASSLTSASGSPDTEPLTLTLCRGEHRMRVGNNIVVEAFPPTAEPVLVGDATGLAVANVNVQTPTTTSLTNVIVRGRIEVSGGEVRMTGGAFRNVAPSVSGNGFVRSPIDLATSGPDQFSVAPGTFIGDNVLFEDNGSPDTAIDLRGGVARLRFGTIFGCTGCTFRNNVANEGGAIYANDGNTQLSLANTTLDGNRSDGIGGAVVAASGVASFENVTAVNNVAGSAGGAFHIGRDNDVVQAAFASCTIRGNSAQSGGGVIVQVFGGATGSATAAFDGTILEESSAQAGGGIFVAGTTTWRGGAIRDNTAGLQGGGAFVRSSFTFTNGALQRNIAGQTGGGAFHLTGSAATYGTVDVGAGSDINSPDTFDADQAAPQSFTRAVSKVCGGSGCVDPT